MPEWINPILGPGGALVVLIIVSRGGFKFLTAIIEKQEIRNEEQSRRFETLHTSTLEHIHEHTTAITKLGEVITKKLEGG